jgi:hypothetical protein
MRVTKRPSSKKLGVIANNRWKPPPTYMPKEIFNDAIKTCISKENAFLLFTKYGLPDLSDIDNKAKLSGTHFAQWVNMWIADEKKKRT